MFLLGQGISHLKHGLQVLGQTDPPHALVLAMGAGHFGEIQHGLGASPAASEPELTISVTFLSISFRGVTDIRESWYQFNIRKNSCKSIYYYWCYSST